MCCSFPVPRSFADTFTIPFASISNVTSICGTPRRAGGIPSSLNCPSDLLSRANCLSPCTTLISTAVWLSAAVENIWLFLVGIVVFLSISLVATPPIVSIERESGVTSRRSTSPAPASPASLPPLDRSTDCYALIRVKRLAWLFSCHLLYLVLYGRNTCRTTYK